MNSAPDLRRITVNSLKFDGTINRSWNCEFLGVCGERFDLRGEFEATVSHPDLGTIAARTLSYEYFWSDRWYSVFEFFDPDGSFRNAYFNINQPPSLEGENLSYIDLDIDVVVWPDGRVVVLDESEFREHSVLFGYPDEVVDAAREALASVLEIANSQTFPHFTASTQQKHA